MGLLDAITKPIKDIGQGLSDLGHDPEKGFSELLSGATSLTPVGEEESLAANLTKSALTSDSNSSDQ